MSEHAILFKPEMVRAVLRRENPKTQTRRLITARNSLVDGIGMSQKRWDAMAFDFSRAWVDAGPSPAGNPGPFLKVPAIRDGDELVHRIYPKLQPGNQLWGRETWAPNTVQPIEHRPPVDFLYAATDSKRYAVGRWRPSIHMPRAASRITLEVTDVRVERLQNISETDAIAEGIVQVVRDPGLGKGGRPGWRWAENEYAGSAVHGYELLWEHINGPGSWGANPWVWVVDFRRLQ